MYKTSVLQVQSCFLPTRPIVVFFTALVAFAAQHYTILYFVLANYKNYRELRFLALAKSILFYLLFTTDRQNPQRSNVNVITKQSIFLEHILVYKKTLNFAEARL